MRRQDKINRFSKFVIWSIFLASLQIGCSSPKEECNKLKLCPIGYLCSNATHSCVALEQADLSPSPDLNSQACIVSNCPQLQDYTPICNAKDYCEYSRTNPSQPWQTYDVWIYAPPGQFPMGAPLNEVGRNTREGPVYTVNFIKGFFINKYEITVLQYDACKIAGKCGALAVQSQSDPNGWGLNSTANGRAMHPQNGMRVPDAETYCDWFPKGRLPSAPEWEYAAVGMRHTKYPWGDTDPTCTLTNYNESGNQSGYGCMSGGTVPAGTKAEVSAMGLRDMAANAAEWLADCSHTDYTGAPSDGSPWVSNCNNPGNRTSRGGSYINTALAIRSSYIGEGVISDGGIPYAGARCIRTM